MHQVIGGKIIDSEDILSTLKNAAGNFIVDIRDMTGSLKRDDLISYLLYMDPGAFGEQDGGFNEDIDLFEKTAALCDEKAAHIVNSIDIKGSIGKVAAYRYDDGKKAFVSAVIIMSDENNLKTLDKLMTKFILNNM